MRISDWSSDVCSSDLRARQHLAAAWSGRRCPRTRDVAASRCRGAADRRDTNRPEHCRTGCRSGAATAVRKLPRLAQRGRRRRSPPARGERRSEEHTSELQSLMRTSYAVFCFKKKTKNNEKTTTHTQKQNKQQ